MQAKWVAGSLIATAIVMASAVPAALQDMGNHVANEWYACARREGVSEVDCARIAPAFVYPGLDLDHVEPANLF